MLARRMICRGAGLLTLMAVLSGAMSPARAQTSAEPLPQVSPGGSLGIALGIPPVPNLRDVGGYAISGGAVVACGLPIGPTLSIR